jgi:hypothetical protein
MAKPYLYTGAVNKYLLTTDIYLSPPLLFGKKSFFGQVLKWWFSDTKKKIDALENVWIVGRSLFYRHHVKLFLFHLGARLKTLVEKDRPACRLHWLGLRARSTMVSLGKPCSHNAANIYICLPGKRQALCSVHMRFFAVSESTSFWPVSYGSVNISDPVPSLLFSSWSDRSTVNPGSIHKSPIETDDSWQWILLEDYPVLTGLSWLSRIDCSVLPVLSWLSRFGCPVLAILSRPSSPDPGPPLLAVLTLLFCPGRPTSTSWPSYPYRSLATFLSGPTWPGWPVLLTCPCWVVPADLSLLTCPCWPVPADLSLIAFPYRPVPDGLSVPTCPDRPVPSDLSCPTCPVRPVPSDLSRPTCPVRPVPSDLSRPTCPDRPACNSHLSLPTCPGRRVPSDMSRPTCSGQPLSADNLWLSPLSWQGCPVTAVLSQLEYYGCPVLSLLSCSGHLICLVPAVLSQLPYPGFPFPPVLSHLSFPTCPFPPVLSHLAFPTCPFPPVLSHLSFPTCPFPPVLSGLSCRSCNVQSVRLITGHVPAVLFRQSLLSFSDTDSFDEFLKTWIIDLTQLVIIGTRETAGNWNYILTSTTETVDTVFNRGCRLDTVSQLVSVTLSTAALWKKLAKAQMFSVYRRGARFVVLKITQRVR